jgi:ankyrin repeat protein
MLVYAIINNNEKIALKLIERGIDINLFDEQGRPILIYSCNYGLDRVSAGLIKLNFNNIIKLKYMYYFCYDILLMCCENNMILTTIEMIKCIKTNNKYQKILNQKDDNGDNLLLYCQKNNRFEIFIELFQFYISDKNITSMIIHLLYNDDSSMRLSVPTDTQRVADHYHDQANQDWSSTGLSYVQALPKPGVLIKFLEYIANNTEYNFDYIINNCPVDFEIGNYNKNSLLMIMCLYRKKEIALKLIDIYEKLVDKNRLKIDHSNKNDDTVFSIACANFLEDVALRLIKVYCMNGISTPEYKKLGALNKQGNTPLSIACQNSLSIVALELLKTGRANQAVDNNIKMTPLMYACENKLEEVALEILKLGKCNIDVRDIVYNKDALSWACEKKLKNVANEILNYYRINRINLNFVVDNHCNTPLILACKNRMSDIAIKLIELNDNISKRALNYARKNKLTNVLEKMEKKLNSIK